MGYDILCCDSGDAVWQVYCIFRDTPPSSHTPPHCLSSVNCRAQRSCAFEANPNPRPCRFGPFTAMEASTPTPALVSIYWHSSTYRVRCGRILRRVCLPDTHLLSLPDRKEATSSLTSFRTVFPVVLVMPRPTYTAWRRPLTYIMQIMYPSCRKSPLRAPFTWYHVFVCRAPWMISTDDHLI